MNNFYVETLNLHNCNNYKNKNVIIVLADPGCRHAQIAQ